MIHTRQELADYCLRSLGGGVIDIEVSNEQVADRIEDAIQFYHEYHFDGIERDYLVHTVSGTEYTVSDTTGWEVSNSIKSVDGLTQAKVYKIEGNVITAGHTMGAVKFAVGDTITNGVQTAVISGIVLGDVDNGYIPAAENIVGVKKIINISNILGSSDYMFNVQYQVMMSEIQNLTKGTVSYFYGVQQYLGHLDFVMKKEKDFRFNRRMDRLYIDVNWTTDLKVGDFVVAEVYRALDDGEFPEMLDDIWLKKYATAIIKKQWAGNLGKFAGVTLPGGIQYNASELYQQAEADRKWLEDEAINSTSPLEFSIG